jgi:rubredoxin
MESYKCTLCGYVYDPSEGDSDGGIEPGVSFVNLPDDYLCPICGAGKEEFIVNN